MSKISNKELDQLVIDAKLIFNTHDIGYNIQKAKLIDKYIFKITVWIDQLVIFQDTYEFDQLVPNGEELMIERIKNQFLLAGFIKYKEIADGFKSM